MTRLRIALLLGCAVSLQLACAAADTRSEPSVEQAEQSRGYAEFEEAPVTRSDRAEAEAPEPAPDSEGRSLVEIERELAANETKLRALGVQIPGAPRPSEGSADFAPAPPQRERDEVQSTKKKKAERAGKQPSAQPAAPNGGAGLGDTTARPDQAKAVRQGPNGEPEVVSPCAQICALSQGTCELRLAICELADRHDEEADYRSACERADEDCVVSEEACHVCSN